MNVAEESTLWTAHIHSDDLPFVSDLLNPGLENRILHDREDEEMMCSQLRAAPHTASRLHQHQGPSHAITVSGSWGHDQKYEYVRGTYVFEPIGVVHKFFAGPEPVDAVFIAYGESQWIDEESGEVGGSMGVRELVEHYFQKCEEQGLPRPNIVTV